MLKKVSVDGFNYAIKTGQSDYSITFEDIVLTNQKIAGIENNGNILMIRKLNSTNSVPAIRSIQQYGMITVLDSELKGGSSAGSAIENENGDLSARNITPAGYISAIKHKGTVVEGTSVSEYVTGNVTSLFPGNSRSLNLPVEETPEYHENDTTQWAKIYSPTYGDTNPWQGIINSGKAVIYWPTSTYMAYDPTYAIPSKVRKLTGFGSVINNQSGDQQSVTFRITEGDENSPPLFIEHFGYGVVIEHLCKRPVVIKHCKLSNYIGSPQAGKVYMEDVELQKLITFYPKQKVWARQFNSEILPGRILNKGADLWVLGIKTELKGYVIKTTDCGKTEVLGGLIYPIQSFTAADSAGFICENAQHSLVFGISSYMQNGIYPTLIRETQNGVVKELKNTSLQGVRFIPLHTSANAACNPAPAPVPANQPPKGSAGPDKNITLPVNSLTLTGTGSDPDGTVSSYSWNQVSGPATAIFSSNSISNPTVSGLVAGSYVFSLVVHDNLLAVSAPDQVIVIVNPAPVPVPVPAPAPAPTPVTPASIISFTLLNADTDKEIGSLTEGYIIDFAATGTRNLAIRANANTSTGSVIFNTNGNGIITENDAPFALAGNNGTDYNAWVPALGSHKVTATPYQSANGTGTAGTALTVNFTVVNTTVTPVPVPTPTPAPSPAPTPTPPNRIPSSNAGPDKNITLPVNSLTLTGTGSDPDGTVSSYVWSQVSGPNTATFSNVSVAEPTVSGLIAGRYVFGLVVQDNQHAFSEADQVAVTVNSAPTPVPTPAPVPAPAPIIVTSYIINAGGGASGRFAADNFAKGGYANVITTSVNTSGVKNPAPASIYQTERYGNFTYTFPSLAAGKSYLVRLHFAENLFSSPNKRKFHVDLNGQRILSKFDVYAAAAGRNKAVVKKKNPEKPFVIAFNSITDNALVNGIEI